MESYIKSNYIGEFIGTITRDIDKYIIEKYQQNISHHTYLIPASPTIFMIRCMGASRGRIKLDSNNIIESIEFYEDVCFTILEIYKKEVVKDITKKYVGSRLIIN